MFDPAQAGPLHAMATALRARLESFFPPARFAHGTVPANLTPKAWGELTRRVPFVGLGLRGIAPDENSGFVLHGQVQWAVFLVVRHARPDARHFGDQTTPGLFGMLSVAAYALNGLELHDAAGRSFGTLRLTRADNAQVEGLTADNDGLAILNLTIPWPVAGEELLDGLDEFLALGATWLFEPDDVAASATDSLTVRDP